MQTLSFILPFSEQAARITQKGLTAIYRIRGATLLKIRFIFSIFAIGATHTYTKGMRRHII